MHPQAIRRVLDEEATKWMQADDDTGDIAVFPSESLLASGVTAVKSNNAQFRSLVMLLLSCSFSVSTLMTIGSGFSL
jgi:hypothetical protein